MSIASQRVNQNNVIRHVRPGPPSDYSLKIYSQHLSYLSCSLVRLISSQIHRKSLVYVYVWLRKTKKLTQPLFTILLTFFV